MEDQVAGTTIAVTKAKGRALTLVIRFFRMWTHLRKRDYRGVAQMKNSRHSPQNESLLNKRVNFLI